ncbi:MAG: sensor hybrid histidine kinase [Planctomycetaceae bacterium]|nr:sensor hybrid histidine kinase [Planctomycetaceae bacterium]
MVGNLTAQVRNLAEVTIGVANDDLSKKITVDVRGEILQLKEATNTMVGPVRWFHCQKFSRRSRNRVINADFHAPKSTHIFGHLNRS